MHNWKITGVDLHSSEHKAVVDLVNKGILEIPKTEDGKYTNIASINTKDSITKEEIVALSQKANINPNQFKHIKTKGEFYKNLVGLLKNINYKVSYSNCYFNSIKPTLTIVKSGFYVVI